MMIDDVCRHGAGQKKHEQRGAQEAPPWQEKQNADQEFDAAHDEARPPRIPPASEPLGVAKSEAAPWEELEGRKRETGQRHEPRKPSDPASRSRPGALNVSHNNV